MNAYSKHDDEFLKKELTDRTNRGKKSEQKKGDPLKRVPTYGLHIISTDLRKTITQREQVETNMLLNILFALW